MRSWTMFAIRDRHGSEHQSWNRSNQSLEVDVGTASACAHDHSSQARRQGSRRRASPEMCPRKPHSTKSPTTSSGNVLRTPSNETPIGAEICVR